MLRRGAGGPALGVCLLAAFLVGCPLPLGRTEAVSAPLAGVLLRQDGLPLAGSEVAITTEWGDTACTQTELRTTTDTAGFFEFPGIRKHYGTTWVIPNLDRGLPRYQLCARVADTLRPAYLGWGSLSATASRDSVSCVEWSWEGQPRVACSGSAEHSFVTGGRWVDAKAEGWYRIFLRDEPTILPKGRRPVLRPNAYLQWLVRSSDGPGYRVVATVELPLDRNVRALTEAVLERRGEQWLARFRGYKAKFLNDFAKARLEYVLGPPGQVTRTEPN